MRQRPERSPSNRQPLDSSAAQPLGSGLLDLVGPLTLIRMRRTARLAGFDFLGLAAFASACAVLWTPDAIGPFAARAEREGPKVDGWVLELITSRMLPLVFGVVAYIVIRTAPNEGVKAHRSSGARTARRILLLAIAIALLSQGEGSIASRYIPLLVGISVGWSIRRLRHRAGIEPTKSGFTPGWRSRLTAEGRAARRDCILGRGVGPLLRTDGGVAHFDRAVSRFRSHGDHRAAAWARAMSLEDAVVRDRLFEAEGLIERTTSDEADLARSPAVLAAQALFLQRLGLVDDATPLLREAVSASRHPPTLLVVRARTSGIVGPELGRLSAWTAAGARDDAAFLGCVLADIRRSTHSSDSSKWSKLVASAARQLAGKAKDPTTASLARGVLAVARGGSSQGIEEQAELVRCEANALLLTAKTAYDARLFTDACDVAMDAVARFEEVRDRRGGGECLVYIGAAGLMLDEVHNDPDLELKMLDSVRAGLQLLETDRGGLRSIRHRYGELTRNRLLIEEVLQLLATQVSVNLAAAGELALWIVESMRRTSLARALAASTDSGRAASAARLELLLQVRAASADSPSGLDELIDRLAAEVGDRSVAARDDSAVSTARTDLQAGLVGLGQRACLHYTCTRRPDGWSVTTVLTSPDGSSCAHVSVPVPKDSGSYLDSAGGVLDAIASGSPAAHAAVFSALALDEDVWRALSAVLLPRELEFTLQRLAPSADDRELLIVPDGPIAGVPFALLPTSNGLLCRHANLAFSPGLGAIDTFTARGGRLTRAVAHVDEDLSSSTSESGTIELLRDLGVVVDMSTTQLDLIAQLDTPPVPQCTYIASHGTGHVGIDHHVLLGDGTTITPMDALDMPWSDTVLLAACWVGYIEQQIGVEPFGIPIACLLRGARSVLGGLAPVSDHHTSSIIRRALPSLVGDGDVVMALGRALRASHLDAPDTVAAHAGVAVWTTLPPRQIVVQPDLRWSIDGLVSS